MKRIYKYPLPDVDKIWDSMWANAGFEDMAKRGVREVSVDSEGLNLMRTELGRLLRADHSPVPDVEAIWRRLKVAGTGQFVATILGEDRIKAELARLLKPVEVPADLEPVTDVEEAWRRIWKVSFPTNPPSGGVWDVMKAELARLIRPVEVPADDAEPVTEEWLVSTGFSRTGGDYHELHISVHEQEPVRHVRSLITWRPTMDLRYWAYQRLATDTDRVALPDLPTRGHVRRLLLALGIEVSR